MINGLAVKLLSKKRGGRCRCLLKMTTARSARFFVNLGLGLVFYGLLVKCCAMSLSAASSIARFQVTVLGGSISCLVTLMVLDFGRVVYLT